MPSSERPAGRRELWTTLPFDHVVPPRAVLTELARGFLLAHDSDPAGAQRFAKTFLKERAGPPAAAPRIVPAERLALVRRGLLNALRDPGPPAFER